MGSIWKGFRSALAVALAACFALCFVSCADEKADVDPDGLSYTIEEMYSTREGMKIYGKLYAPKESDGKIPAVILSHSANMTADSMNAYAAGFAERGFLAYAFDFCGGSSSSRSDGTSKNMTLFTECDDLKAALSTVSALDGVDEEKIYLFGTSQGGLVSALVAEDCADRIRGEILLYPAFNIPELASSFSGLSPLFSVVGCLFLGWGACLFDSFGGGYGLAFTHSLKDYDAYAHIGNFGKEVLILHGSADFIVDPSCSEKAAALYPHCTLRIIEGAGHGFNSENYSIGGDYDAQVWEHIDEYLAK